MGLSDSGTLLMFLAKLEQDRYPCALSDRQTVSGDGSMLPVGLFCAGYDRVPMLLLQAACGPRKREGR